MTNKNSTKYIDHLTEDDPIPCQMWVCISFLSPEGIQNCSLRGLKIRGVFATKEEADKRASDLQKIDPDFHVFVGEMGKWLPWDPDPNDVTDQVYSDKRLNDIMIGYKNNIEKAKQMQIQRKKEMIQQAAKEEQSKETKTHKRLKKECEKRKQDAKINSLLNKQQENEHISDDENDVILTEKEKELKQVEEKIKNEELMAKSERLRLTEAQKQINEKEQNLETIDSKLAKIQELYNALNKKKTS